MYNFRNKTTRGELMVFLTDLVEINRKMSEFGFDEKLKSYGLLKIGYFKMGKRGDGYQGDQKARVCARYHGCSLQALTRGYQEAIII